MALPQALAAQLAGAGNAAAGGPQDAAKKAAQDALQEAIAQQGMPAGAGAPKAIPEMPVRWTVPQMPAYMDLDNAVDEAMQDAKRFMNHRMQSEGVVLTLQQIPGQTPGQDKDTWQALVVEHGSDRVLQKYGGTDLLKLYSAHHAGRGVVVDGEV